MRRHGEVEEAAEGTVRRVVEAFGFVEGAAAVKAKSVATAVEGLGAGDT